MKSTAATCRGLLICLATLLLNGPPPSSSSDEGKAIRLIGRWD